MYRFNNDYSLNAHPAVLKAVSDISGRAYGGYGLDEICDEAAGLIKKRIGAPDAEVHFLVGGTQTNYTVISASLLPYQSVLCAESGHINVHETGAVEHIGHKITALPHTDGKITAGQIAKAGENFRISDVQEHITEPGMVYISFPTEYGTVYTLQELEEIRTACDEYGLVLFIDGARLGYGLAAEGNDVTIGDIARLSDVFYIGGTKCGALFGEAVVIRNKRIGHRFRSHIKQNGGMLAKGFLLGTQFRALFTDDLYFTITEQAVEKAMRIKEAFRQKGIPSFIDSPTNQQFVLLTERQCAAFSENFVFENEGAAEDGMHISRFCTSWGTTEEETEALISAIRDLNI
ncbi:MAG: low specificity L-threonine aldolase [Lachnospiraceae bacterium]|nr:low specificity L-threonine aldolase [Lachnospiraceae bacterium]